jgi:hypothetical protein
MKVRVLFAFMVLAIGGPVLADDNEVAGSEILWSSLTSEKQQVLKPIMTMTGQMKPLSLPSSSLRGCTKNLSVQASTTSPALGLMNILILWTMVQHILSQVRNIRAEVSAASTLIVTNTISANCLNTLISRIPRRRISQSFKLSPVIYILLWMLRNWNWRIMGIFSQED